MAAGSLPGPGAVPETRRLAISVLTALLSLGKGPQVRGGYARKAGAFLTGPRRGSRRNYLALIVGEGYGWADAVARLSAGILC